MHQFSRFLRNSAMTHGQRISLLFPIARCSLFIALSAVSAHAASYTSTAAGGNWNDPATWAGAGVPGNGDTAVISAGASVTIPAGNPVTVGTGAGDAVTLDHGTLILNDDLTLKGSMKIITGDARITQNGRTITLAVPNAGDNFSIYSVGVSGSRKVFWTINGISKSSPGIVQKQGSGTAAISLGSDAFSGYDVNWNNFKMVGLGKTGVDAIIVCPCGSTTANHLALTNGRIENSSGFSTSATIDAADNFSIQNVTWANALSAINLSIFSAAGATGLRILKGNVFDQAIQVLGPGFTIDNNVFRLQIYMTTASASFENNVITSLCSGAPDAILISASNQPIANNYFYFCHDNPHAISGGGGQHLTITGNIFETDVLGGTDSGDLIFSMGASQVSNNLTIVPQDRGSVLLTFGPPNIPGIDARNNTIIQQQGAACSYVGETIKTVSHMVSAYRNNICYSKNTGGGIQFTDLWNPPAADVVDSMDYNLGWHLAQSYPHMTQSAVTYGVHDLTADPQFFDMSRSLSAWDATLGGTGTGAHALAELSKMNDAAGYNSGYNAAALVAWVKDGYRPTNPALKNAGDPQDGSPDIGALPVLSGAPSPVTVKIAPLSVTLTAAQSQQFNAFVTGTTDPRVSWSYSPAVGTLSVNGLYAAPGAISSVQTVTVTAQSLADPTKSGQVIVTLSPGVPSTNPPPPTGITVTPPPSLTALRVYPNPWRKDRHGDIPMTFDHLPAGSTIKLFTISGHLVKTIGVSTSPTTWTLTNDKGEKVASGIYLYLITDGQGNKTRGKLAVIR